MKGCMYMYKICSECKNKEICKLYDTILMLDPIKVTDCKFYVKLEESNVIEFKPKQEQEVRDYNSVNDYIKKKEMENSVQCSICKQQVNKNDIVKCDRCNIDVCQACVDIEIEGDDNNMHPVAICHNCNPNKQFYSLHGEQEFNITYDPEETYTITLNDEEDF